MRISSIVSLVPSSKISDVIDKIFKAYRMNGRGTYETKTGTDNCCYFWAMTPAKAWLSVRQLPHCRFWIFEGYFPGNDPAQAQRVGLQLSDIDSLCRIIAMGEGQAWYFDHIAKIFKKTNTTVELPAQ